MFKITKWVVLLFVKDWIYLLIMRRLSQFHCNCLPLWKIFVRIPNGYICWASLSETKLLLPKCLLICQRFTVSNFASNKLGDTCCGCKQQKEKKTMAVIHMVVIHSPAAPCLYCPGSARVQNLTEQLPVIQPHPTNLLLNLKCRFNKDLHHMYARCLNDAIIFPHQCFLTFLQQTQPRYTKCTSYSGNCIIHILK